MTIKAIVYGGVQIGGILPAKCYKSFDGVWMELRGTTLEAGKWVPAGMTIEMSQADALDMALALILAAEQHAEYAAKSVPTLVKRLNRRMERKRNT